VFAAVLLVTLIAIVLFALVTLVERLMIPWARAGPAGRRSLKE
jgi:ABC-type nitrate/sulfonate/bicarbonate transport system permease component